MNPMCLQYYVYKYVSKYETATLMVRNVHECIYFMRYVMY